MQLPGWMSLTRTVPAAVPSLFHSSSPCAAVVGREEQRAVDVRQVAGTGYELPPPGLMSLTRTVPAAVPSLFHSSTPLTPSSAEKNSVPFTFVSRWGSSCRLPGLMSLTRTVPAAVPSLFHSSTPCGAVVGREEQRAVDVGQVDAGPELGRPGRMSLTRRCRRRCRRSSTARCRASPSSAAKNSVPLTFVRSMNAVSRPPGARVDVLDQDGAGGRAVALPQLPAVDAVIGHEEQRAVDVRQVGRGGAEAAGDVMSLTGAHRRGQDAAIQQLEAGEFDQTNASRRPLTARATGVSTTELTLPHEYHLQSCREMHESPEAPGTGSGYGSSTPDPVERPGHAGTGSPSRYPGEGQGRAQGRPILNAPSRPRTRQGPSIFLAIPAPTTTR